MSNKPMNCEIGDLDQENQLCHVSESLGGERIGNCILFDNDVLKGQIVSSAAEKGLTIRKWKCIPLQNILINKHGLSNAEDKKFLLLYFLSPAVLQISQIKKKVRFNGSRNNVLLGENANLQFQFFPGQPIHIFEISFTLKWLIEHLTDAELSIKDVLEDYIRQCNYTTFSEPFTSDEFKTLHELELCMTTEHSAHFFIRSRTYNLVVSFLSKIINKKEAAITQAGPQYDQLIQAAMLVIDNPKKLPSIASIARKVSMSVPSLVRKFKLVYGKSIYEFYIEHKMQLARKMIVEYGISIRSAAKMLGYNQASAFIETFAKQHGHTPGALKQASREFAFF